MWAYNLLRTKYFHGISSGNQHPCLLKSRYGKVRLDGSLTSLVPIIDCLLVETCLGVVMRHEFWLCLSGLRKLGFEHLSNALMILLSQQFPEEYKTQ
jgi:hypothetical protein